MHWTVAAPFTLDPEANRWLVPFVPGDRHEFTLVPARPSGSSWHARTRTSSGVGDWTPAWMQAHEAWRSSRGGVLTVFPELAVMAGVHQRFGLRRKPVVAWCFNVGHLPGGLKGAAARAALHRVDRFVVHSRAEVIRYAEWLDLPPERFQFVPLQRAAITVEEREDEEHPFVLSMGSARRDYATLFEAVRRTGYRTFVIAAPHAVEGLAVPDNVEIRRGLTARECQTMAQRARVNVVPVLNDETASGQVTILEAMRMRRAVVATRCIGSEDYVADGTTGLLVAPGNVDALHDAIQRLWEDPSLRDRLGRAAGRFAEEHCSDEAAGAALGRLLDAFG